MPAFVYGLQDSSTLSTLSLGRLVKGQWEPKRFSCMLLIQNLSKEEALPQACS